MLLQHVYTHDLQALCNFQRLLLPFLFCPFACHLCHPLGFPNFRFLRERFYFIWVSYAVFYRCQLRSFFVLNIEVFQRHVPIVNLICTQELSFLFLMDSLKSFSLFKKSQFTMFYMLNQCGMF